MAISNKMHVTIVRCGGVTLIGKPCCDADDGILQGRLSSATHIERIKHLMLRCFDGVRTVAAVGCGRISYATNRNIFGRLRNI